MISNLAKETVVEWQNEGLAPTFEDIVRLNRLGLDVERGERAAEFSALPRVAFLGDNVFTEPSVGKWMWIDSALALVPRDDTDRRMTIVAFAMNTPDNELAAIRKVSDLDRLLEDFKVRILAPFAPTQIEAAVSYAALGGDPHYEDADGERRSAADLPRAVRSTARALLSYAVAAGLDAAACSHVTIAQLDRMIAVAAMIRGAAVSNDEHAEATGRFYRAADEIHARLTNKNKEENDGND